VNAKLLAVIMISGLVLSGSSVYLNKMAFAETPWPQIAQQQPIAQQSASTTYSAKYQYNNMNESQRSWSGLTSYTTVGYAPGGGWNLPAQANASMNNALAGYTTGHGLQLSSEATNYTGLNSTTTGENGRDRNTLIADARAQVLNASESLIPISFQRSANFTNLNDSGTTNEQNAYNRQALIEQTWNSMDTQASALVGNVTMKDPAYMNLQDSGTTTGYMPGSRNLPGEAAASESNGVQIFQEIHAKVLSATYATGYAGLSSTTTNEQNAYNRQAQIEDNSQLAIQNAMNIYNEYYPSNDLSHTKYSH
jgi:hypothetical protein